MSCVFIVHHSLCQAFDCFVFASKTEKIITEASCEERRMT